MSVPTYREEGRYAYCDACGMKMGRRGMYLHSRAHGVLDSERRVTSVSVGATVWKHMRYIRESLRQRDEIAEAAWAEERPDIDWVNRQGGR